MMPVDDCLAGMVALVTGAGRGIGRAIALELAAHGATVACCARSLSELEEVAGVIGQMHPGLDRAAVVPLDVSSEDECVRAVAQTVERFGRLDILINNAGIGVFGPLESLDAGDWDRVMAVNARGTFLLCRESIPHLRKHAKSFIINIASVVGVKGYPNQSAYAASKHAIMGMSSALAKEVQKDGIRVHAICPGGVDTDMVGDARPDLDRSGLIRSEELAEMVMFLLTRKGNGVVDVLHVRREGNTPWV